MKGVEMEIQSISEKIDRYFNAKNDAREKALVYSRQAIQYSGRAIRAIHRNEIERAEKLSSQAKVALDQCQELLRDHPDIFYAGFVQDAQKEYVEAMATCSLIKNKSLPDPETLGMGYAPYVNGIAEAIGELRRHILDLIRQGKPEEGEELLEFMDEIFYLLASLDYPDAITGGLRRSTDVARAIMEKTRGDLTNALRQRKLMNALKGLEEKL